MKSFAQLDHISIMVTQEKKPGSRGSDSEEGSLIVDDVRQEVLKPSQVFSSICKVPTVT